MLIIGARGFAKEVLEILFRKGIRSILFYDDINNDVPNRLYNQFHVLKNLQSAKNYFENEYPGFTLGVGGTLTRQKLYDKFIKCGGKIESVISQNAEIGSFGNELMDGINIMSGAIITNSVKIGLGTLINVNCTIGHDSEIGNFCELSPGVHISGNCKIGDFCALGTNSSVLPGISITNNVTVGASALVIKNITEPGTYIGLPAKQVI